MRLKALGCLVVGLAGYALTGTGPAASAPGSGRSTAASTRPAPDSGRTFAAAAPAAGRTFAASAEAEGMRVTFEAPEFLVVSTLFDAANPISQATLESTGVSRAFASAPYPGDLIVTAPGTLAAFGGPSLPAQYPFYVAANHPEAPKAALEGPGGAYALAANAEAGRSAATGRLSVDKGPVVRTEALTETLADGAVRAVASSVTEGIVAGDGALTISRVISSVETISRSDAAEPIVTRRFEITGAKVGDTAVEITADGVKAGSGALPLGGAAKPVQEALAQAGVDVRVEGDEALQGGGTARTLIIRSTQQAPLPGAPKGILTIRIGGAATAVLTGAAADVEIPDAIGGVPSSDSPAGTAPSDPCQPGGSPATGSSGAGSSGVGSTAGSSGAGSSGVGSTAGSPGPGPAGGPETCAGPDTGLSGAVGSGGAGTFGGSGGAGTAGPSGVFDAAPGSETALGTDGGASAAGDGTALAAGPDTAQIASVPTALPVRRAVRWIFVVLGVGGALALAASASFRRQGVQSTWTF